jgi:hypothetical protein
MFLEVAWLRWMARDPRFEFERMDVRITSTETKGGGQHKGYSTAPHELGEVCGCCWALLALRPFVYFVRLPLNRYYSHRAAFTITPKAARLDACQIGEGGKVHGKGREGKRREGREVREGRKHRKQRKEVKEGRE